MWGLYYDITQLLSFSCLKLASLLVFYAKQRLVLSIKMLHLSFHKTIFAKERMNSTDTSMWKMNINQTTAMISFLLKDQLTE